MSEEDTVLDEQEVVEAIHRHFDRKSGYTVCLIHRIEDVIRIRQEKRIKKGLPPYAKTELKKELKKQADKYIASGPHSGLEKKWHGIDILAHGEDYDIYIECKGSESPKTEKESTEDVQRSAFRSMFQEFERRHFDREMFLGAHKEYTLALGLPITKVFKKAVARNREKLRENKVDRIFWVKNDKSISLEFV